MFKKAMGAVALAALTACGGMPKYVPLDPAARTSLKSIQVRQAFPQDEIYVVAQNFGASAALGGGLIGALIDSQVSKTRQQGIQSTVEPFYASIDDVNLRETFWSVLAPQVQQSFAGQIGAVHAGPAFVEFNKRLELVDTLKADEGMLYIYTRYSFSADYSRLVTSTLVDLWRAGSREPIFSNVYTYQSTPVASASIASWSAEQGRAYREAVQEGAKEVSQMMALDLAHPRIGGVDQGLSTAATPVTLPAHGTALSPFMGLAIGEVKVTGRALDDRAQRVVLRDGEGRLWSLAR